MNQEQSLGQLELEVLKLAWDQPGSSVNDLTDALLQQKSYARTTVLTVIQRLHKKGFLSRKKQGGSFRYFPTDTEKKVMGGLTKRFINKAFGGSAFNLVQHLTQTELSEDELDEMRKLIDQAKKAEENK